MGYTRLTIYTDGASRDNPGRAAAGIHMVDATNLATIKDLGFDLGIATNNEAEWMALLQALKWLLKHKQLLANDVQISFRLDSQVVVLQLAGRYRITAPHLQPLAEAVQECLRQLPGTYTCEHIPRNDNTYADRLANDILDGLRQPDQI